MSNEELSHHVAPPSQELESAILESLASGLTTRRLIRYNARALVEADKVSSSEFDNAMSWLFSEGLVSPPLPGETSSYNDDRFLMTEQGLDRYTSPTV